MDDTNSLRNESGSEVEGDLERNMSINGDEKIVETSEDIVLKLLQTIPDEQSLNSWINTVGGSKKGRIYGFASDIGIIGDSLHISSASSSVPILSVSAQQIIEAPEFQKIINRLLEQNLGGMQTSMQESVLTGIRVNIQAEVQVAVRAVMSRLILPQPPNDF
ncbi:hypothetical protein HAX54_015405, partial [Datura stramonium]|nr:hypothetical protein [Datura stramonium]